MWLDGTSGPNPGSVPPGNERLLTLAAGQPDPQAAPPGSAGGPSPASTNPGARPFPAALGRGRFAWAGVDGRDTNVLARLARHPAEYERLLEENGRILRRQLVYLEPTTAVLAQRALARGEPLRSLTLPGLDGTEVPVEVDRLEWDPAGEGGAVIGHVAGQPGSLVTVAFYRGREAFTVLSPDTGICLQGHPREPGQVWVTSFDPETYLPLPCGEPIRTNP